MSFPGQNSHTHMWCCSDSRGKFQNPCGGLMQDAVADCDNGSDPPLWCDVDPSSLPSRQVKLKLRILEKESTTRKPTREVFLHLSACLVKEAGKIDSYKHLISSSAWQECASTSKETHSTIRWSLLDISCAYNIKIANICFWFWSWDHQQSIISGSINIFARILGILSSFFFFFFFSVIY